MTLKNVNTVLVTACALFVLYLGLSFILTPEASTHGVGLPEWPAGNGDGFLIMKGTRECAMGLVLGILLMTGHRRALGWALLMDAVAPFGDMINVLAHHGSNAAAFGIHGMTSALIAIIGLLVLRETNKTHKATAPTPTAQPV
ncbi:DUF4267 domain-containing protein [Streptomyces sp. NPDC001709]